METTQSEQVVINIESENIRSNICIFAINTTIFVIGLIIILLIGFGILYGFGMIYDVINNKNYCDDIMQCLMCGVIVFIEFIIIIFICGVIGTIIIGSIFLIIKGIREFTCQN